MSGFCPTAGLDDGVVRGMLTTVDCNVRVYSQAGYLALTGPGSIFPTELTALMTIYVAMLGFRLMFGVGGARLNEAPLIAVKIGFILAVTLNWTTFQTLFFDVASKAPLEVARIIASPAGQHGPARDPLGGLQAAYDQLTKDAGAFGTAAGPNPQILKGGDAAAADGLWKASAALYMTTAGTLAIATIAVGVLAAVGPIFIALFLFDATRGLFEGWLRALAAAAITPMVCWITTSIFLVVVDPWLDALAKSRDAGQLSVPTATTVIALVFVFAAAQTTLAISGGAIAGGFSLPVFRGRDRAARGAEPVPVTINTGPSRAERLAHTMQHQSFIAERATRTTVGRTPVFAELGSRLTPTSGDLGPIAPSYRRNSFGDRLGQIGGKIR